MKKNGNQPNAEYRKLKKGVNRLLTETGTSPRYFNVQSAEGQDE